MREIEMYRAVLIEGLKYTIELSTSSIFKNSVYLGTNLINGRTVWVFEITGKRLLEINPSFHTYILEDEAEFEEELDSAIPEPESIITQP